MDADVQSLAAAARHLLASLSQDTRLIEIDTTLPGTLVVERFDGSESVCANFKFDIDCLSTSAFRPSATSVRYSSSSRRN